MLAGQDAPGSINYGDYNSWEESLAALRDQARGGNGANPYDFPISGKK